MASPVPPRPDAAPPGAATPRFALGRAADRLGPWSFYFLAKLLLLWRGLLAFNPIENLVFLVVLAGPLAAPRAKRFRPWIGVPVAIALLYHDSYLPKASRVLAQVGTLSGFSAQYLLELAGRFVSLPVLGMLGLAAVLFFVAARFVRTDALALAAILAVAPFQPPFSARPAVAAKRSPGTQAVSPDVALKAFHEIEAGRRVDPPASAAAGPPFDILIVHVCSLSWDDLEAIGLDQHPLLKGFDIVLRRFNTVSAYSGPAAIRLLRGNCGQQAHPELFQPPPEGCLLLAGLERAGFATNLAMNHDGHFDDFLQVLRGQSVTATPVPLAGVPAHLKAFDDSRVHDDFAVLQRWLERRQKDKAPRVAAFYNTVTLHDGNRLVGYAGKDSLETYKTRVATLLSDLDRFVQKLEASGRRTVVAIVPEHGAALRGEPAQIAGLREIPSPAITLVPVGLRVVGPGAKRVGEPLAIDEPTSYLALAHLLAGFVERPPFGDEGFRPADYAMDLPETPFVSESENTVVMRQGGRLLVRQDKDAWRELPVRPR